jgi:type III restriction enzyme
MDENEVSKEIKLKEIFKKTPFYKYGLIYLNDRTDKDYRHVKSFADLGVKKLNYVHVIATGHGGASTVLAEKRQGAVFSEENRKDLSVGKIEHNIIQSAIARNPFFSFASLKRYFPNLETLREFITSGKYLGGLEITFQGNVYHLDENKFEKLSGMMGLLNQIKAEVQQQITEHQGTRDFRKEWIRDIFTDKMLKFDKNNERAKEDAQFDYFVSGKEWFAYNTIYGTSEEKSFVRMLDRHIEKLKAEYENIYLVRNEGHFAIYNFADGQAFQPDFVLFLRERSGKLLTYQIFIEPKGKHLRERDRWKEKFLKEITEEFGDKVLKFQNKSKYRLIGVPFYNNEDENKFRESLEAVLN